MEKSQPERQKSWKEIVKKFTKETTFHGLKYIAEDSHYVSRRLVVPTSF